MKLFLKIAGVCLAFLMQSIIFENIKIFSVSPDILLVAIVISAVSADSKGAAITGAIAGLLKDAICARVFGLNILFYMYLALIVNFLVSERTHNSPLIMSFVSFSAITVFEVVLTLFKILFGYDASLTFLGASILVKGLFGAVFSLLFVMLCQKIKTKRNKKQIPVTEENI